MSEAPLRATLKAGNGYDAPWLGVDASTPEELVERLTAVANLGVSEALVNAANVLKAVNAAAPIAADVASPPQNTASGGGTWSNSPQSNAPTWSQPQQQAAPAQQAPQQQRKYGGPPHPEGKTCEICPNVLEFKKTSTGKGTWRCPDWRWNNGSPNGHSSEFAD